MLVLYSSVETRSQKVRTDKLVNNTELVVAQFLSRVPSEVKQVFLRLALIHAVELITWISSSFLYGSPQQRVAAQLMENNNLKAWEIDYNTLNQTVWIAEICTLLVFPTTFNRRITAWYGSQYLSVYTNHGDWNLVKIYSNSKRPSRLWSNTFFF